MENTYLSIPARFGAFVWHSDLEGSDRFGLFVTFGGSMLLVTTDGGLWLDNQSHIAGDVSFEDMRGFAVARLTLDTFAVEKEVEGTRDRLKLPLPDILSEKKGGEIKADSPFPLESLPASAQRFPIFYESADDQHCTETRALLHLIAQSEGAILEIGTHCGIKAMEIAKNFPNRQVISVDWSHAKTTMREEQAGEQLAPYEIGMRCRDLTNVALFDANSQTLDYEDLSAQFGTIGFIFIDGDHSESGVWADTKNAIEYADKAGAMIAWHDANADAPAWVGVRKVLLSLYSQGLTLAEIEGTRIAYSTHFVKKPEQGGVEVVDTDDGTLPRYVDTSLLPPHQRKENLPPHWQNERIEAAIWTRGLPPQLTINGEPLAHAYVPPDCSKWKFAPCAGGNSIWEHLPFLADVASKAGVIVEIGIATMNGSTHAFDLGLAASEAAEGRKRHIGVDVHPTISGPWVPSSPWWEFVSGSSHEAETVEKVRRALTLSLDGDGQQELAVDILYIDTIHEKWFLQKELEVWLPLIGPKTLVLFHDTHRGGSYHEMTDAILEVVAEEEYHEHTTIPAGPLYATHGYIQISTSCEGMGALMPKAGWIE